MVTLSLRSAHKLSFRTDIESLPAETARSQFVILRSYRRGYKNSKEVSKALSMNRKGVDVQTSALVSKGYIAKDNKLTSKALEIPS